MLHAHAANTLCAPCKRHTYTSQWSWCMHSEDMPTYYYSADEVNRPRIPSSGRRREFDLYVDINACIMCERMCGGAM